jgi:hypothetical protein
MKKLNYLFVFIGFLSISFYTHTAFAQKTDFQSWSLLTANISLDSEKKWLLYLEEQVRVGHDFNNLERTLTRPAIGYNYDKNLTFYLGYAWTPTYINTSYDDDFRDEHRIWQQILYKHTYIGLDWQHRLRQEQRFIDDASSAANRTRYLLRASYKFTDSDTYGLTAYNELFVNLNTVERGPRAGFDRDRFFVGPFFQVDNARYELGYLGEFGKRFGNDDRMINVLFVSANFNF